MPTQAPPDSDLGFPAKGSLKRVPFAFLIRDIARTQTTGNLYLLAGETKKVVFFVDGRPTLVRSNLPAEFLGQILTDQGLITQEQCDNTLEAIRRTGKKQGELLVEMGILSEGNLRYGLEEQVRIKLLEIFGWEEGRFQFKQSGEPGMPATGMSLEQPVEALILAGVQERWTDERARAALKALAERYPVVQARWNADASTLDLLPEEAYFLRCLDGSRTIDELLARKYDPEVPQVSTLLFGLIAAGVVEASETKQARRLPPPRPNLAPANVSDDALAPKFEQLSAITEYEDTPLPNKLPGGAAISSSRNPRIPILPTEDEEMFRGLDIDESIVTDTRALLRGIDRGRGAPARTQDSVARPAPPRPLDEESDFSDLGGGDDDDAETDFSGLVHTTRPGINLQVPPPSGPTSGPGDSVLPQPPLADADESARQGSSSAAQATDSGKSPLPTPRPDTGKTSTPGATPASLAQTPAVAPAPTLGGPRPTLGAPTTPGAPTTFGGPRLPAAPQPITRQPTAPQPVAHQPTAPQPIARQQTLPQPVAPEQAEPPVMDPLDDLDPDLGDLDEDIEVLDDDEEFDDPLADELGDGPLTASGPALIGGDDDDDVEPLGDSSLSEGSAVLPVIELGEDNSAVMSITEIDPSSSAVMAISEIDPGSSAVMAALPDLDDDDLDARSDHLAGEPARGPVDEPAGEFGDELGDQLGDLDSDALLGDLDEDLELEDVELEGLGDLGDLGDDFGDAAQVGYGRTSEDTDGGFRPMPGPESAAQLGATRYGQAEEAMREGDYDQAVALFEDAYANGYDVPELHAHLAFCRFRASGNDPSSAPLALELLDWAEQADPGFPMIHAYRGAILVGLGRQEEADECFDRALYLDPENELAIAYTRGE